MLLRDVCIRVVTVVRGHGGQRRETAWYRQPLRSERYIGLERTQGRKVASIHYVQWHIAMVYRSTRPIQLYQFDMDWLGHVRVRLLELHRVTCGPEANPFKSWRF